MTAPLRIDVAVTPAALPPLALEGMTVLVIDVLRASTTMTTALANGCAAIVPVADADEARRRAAEHPAEHVLVAGERRGEPIPGFDLGNSPIEFAAPRVRGKIVIFTTSNGTGALLAARRAADVGVASLVNLTAAATWALAQGRDVIALCAGERGAQSLEDYVCAGLLVDRLAAAAPTARPTARAAEAAHAGRAYGKDVARLRKDAPWARRLIAAGRGDDVGVCLALDTATLVPRYLAAVDKVVAGP